MNPFTRNSLSLALVASMGAAGAAWGQSCPSGAISSQKNRVLYLLYPSSQVNNFPEWTDSVGNLYNTNPVPAFDITDVTTGINAANLRNRVQQLTEVAYCEFDVDVQTITSFDPSPPDAQWQIVAISTDTDANEPIGVAQDVDTGDSVNQDHARFWVGNLENWTGAELDGGNSTLERWSTALTNLIAHESGHNYGASHANSSAVAGEDATVNHFMANPGLGANPDSIVDGLNHFSDTTYEILGHNIGLNIKTLHNWDFVNPNSSDADSLVLTLLSEADSLSLGWVYNGTLSPWRDPTIVKQSGTITLDGTAYNIFELTFSTDKSWSGGADGIAPPDVKFHVGASFAESDAVIVREATLQSGGSDLTLKPRMFGYDAGVDDSGSFAVTIINPNPGDGEMFLADMAVFFSPRMIDIETMLEGVVPRGMNGLPVQPFASRRPLDGLEGVPRGPGGSVRIGDEPLEIELAQLTDKRHVDITHDYDACVEAARRDPPDDGPFFGDPDVIYCQDGTSLSLFPATYTYVTATVIEPNATYWDPSLSSFVTGPRETRLYFQASGIVPDFNANGIDDLLDIRTGASDDRNNDGVPDEAQPGVGGSLWRINARLGLTFPHGSPRFDSDLSAQIGFERSLTAPWSLEGVLGYHRLDDDGAGFDLDALQVGINARRYWATSSPSLRPYLSAGVSAYLLDPGSTELGINLGVGVQRDITARAAFEAAYHYHRVSASPDIKFSAGQLGLSIAF